ncbi:MAG: hypothetical protein AAGC93_11955 [Cyanobacteria bacterium P01_F01_bin.53]
MLGGKFSSSCQSRRPWLASPEPEGYVHAAKSTQIPSVALSSNIHAKWPMNTLATQFHELSGSEKRKVHLSLGEHALSKWREFCATHPRMDYVETVCGTHQTVDTQLPADAFQSAREGRDIKNVAKRYQEPIVAIQDDDLIFPDPTTFAYYALYNLFNKYAKHKSVDDWLIVNQALSSEQNESQWQPLLDDAIKKAI